MIEETYWTRALVPEPATLQDAIRSLEQSGLRIVLLVDACTVLLGTVSDGDIRRGLLKGYSLTDSLSLVANRAPLVVSPGTSDETVAHLMLASKVQQVPIVDDRRRVVGLHALDDLYTIPTRDNLMVIMAGGKGTRLHPYTKNCPKPLLPVAGKPMLEHIVERGKMAGFRNYAISVNYLGEMIEEYFGDGEKWGVSIRYIHEDRPLGTAGALGLLSPAPGLPFVVSNGDVLTDINYGELLNFHLQHAALATMAVRIHEWQNPYGVVHTDGIRIASFEEKPIVRSYINAGVYVLDPCVLARLPNGSHCDMPDLFKTLRVEAGRVIAYPMHEPWLDVGRPEDLIKARREQQEKL